MGIILKGEFDVELDGTLMDFLLIRLASTADFL